MFSKELENLIQATLEDGVLEEYEKAALVKRATAEGVDLAELEIYINSILQKRQRELNEKKNAEFAKVEQQKKEAIGKVCPKCGKQATPMTLVCECGYEFASKKASSSVQDFSEKINNIVLSDIEMKSCYNTQNEFSESKRNKLLDDKRRMLISSFPVPNTKEDIMEFLSLATPFAKKKGGIFGTIIGRLAVFLLIVVIAALILYMLLPEYEEFQIEWSANPKFDKKPIALPYTIMFAVVASIISFVLAFFVGKETLRWNNMAKTWRAKFDQVLMKGRSLRADAEFKQMLDYYEQQVNKK